MLFLLPLALLTSASPPRDIFAEQCGAVADGFDEAQQPSSRTGLLMAKLTAIPSFCTGWTVVLIEHHWPADRGAQSWWSIRYNSRRLRGAPLVRWADSRRCPAVRGVLVAMKHLPLAMGLHGLPEDTPPPTSHGPLPPPPPPPPPPDGTDYTLSGDFEQPDHSSAEVTLRTNWGPLAHWAESIAPALEACWTETPPAGLSRS